MSTAEQLPPQPPTPIAGRMTIARFAEAARRLNENRMLVDQIRAQIVEMEPTRLVPLGAEKDLVRALDDLVMRATDQITQMSTGTSVVNRECLTRLEGLLDAPEWRAASTTLRELTMKRGVLDDFVRALTEERGSYRLPFKLFHAAVEKATNLGIEVPPDDWKLATEVEGRFRSSDAEFDDGRYDSVAVALELARAMLKDLGLAEAEDFENHRELLEQQIAEREVVERKMGRRAELFVISGSPVGKDVPYKVMLRRPGHEHVQETNLYDDIVVLEMDQELFRDTIEQITDDAVDGIRSATALAAIRRARPQRSESPQHLRQLDPERRLEMIGRRMYGLLIPDAMQRLIDETPDFPLTITSNNPELPWELMHDGRQFLCLQRMFARMPAGQTFPRRSRDSGGRLSTHKRVLLISSGSDEDLPEAVEEIREIEDELKPMATHVSVTTVTGNDVTSGRLTDELGLGNYDLVHYAGHAGFDSSRPELSYLLLPNGERFRAERVQRLLEGHPIVFLNACESSKSAPQAVGRSTGSTVAQSQGLATAFVYGGAQACVGSLWPVFDDTARAFAREFYRKLIQKSERVGEALRLARLECRRAHQDRLTWAAYALYGDPAYRLGAPPTTNFAAPG